jgi:hypothetical protein
MPHIISLRETAPSQWQARYQGNYGVYTIKITLDGAKLEKFSCTCPSDYSPCKHIGMVREAIAEKCAKNKKAGKDKGLSPEMLLKDLDREELYNFIVGQLKYIPELYDRVMLEFSHKAKAGGKNNYSLILRKALAALDFYDDYEYYDSEEWRTLDLLDEWLEKAQGYIKQKNGAEAAMIAMAFIEEYAPWLKDLPDEISESFDESYITEPFTILEAAAQTGLDKKELFDYCMSEMKKDKYRETYFLDGFNLLLMKIAAGIDPGAFITLQEKLLAKVKDTDSYEAEKILKREIDFYRKIHKPAQAWKLIEDNVQIVRFRQMLIEKKIAGKKYAEAKKLIQDHLDSSHNKNDYYSREWNQYLLDIAGKEKDNPAKRMLSFTFIKDFFSEEHYRIYKSTFSAAEWPMELEKLIAHYEKKNYNNESLFNLLTYEKDTEKLLHYVGKHLSLGAIVKYHPVFAPPYPEKTLGLFRKALDSYVEAHVGRSYYEEVIGVFKKIDKIKNGHDAVMDMIASYKTRYKARRAFMELLTKYSKVK